MMAVSFFDMFNPQCSHTKSTTVWPGLKSLCFSFNLWSISTIEAVATPYPAYLEKLEGRATLQSLHACLLGEVVVALP